MALTPLSVLLIEDNPGDVRLIRALLAEVDGAAITLEWVDRLAPGLDRLSRQGIDLVLLDLSLPDSMGLDTFIRAHDEASHIPIIVLSGLDDQALAVRAVREGAQDYLVKGQVDGLMLARLMRYAIERHRLAADLAERTRQLETSQNRLGTIVAHTSDGLLVIDSEGVIRFMNPAAATLLGCSAEATVGQRFGIPYVFEDATEVTYIDCLITRRHAEMQASRTVWDGKQAYLLSLRDVTARKQAEDEVRFQAHLLNAVQQTVFATDLTASLTYWNPFAEKLCGWSAEEVVGRSIFEAVPTNITDVQARELFANVQAGNIWTGELIVQRKDGTTFPVEIIAGPLYNEYFELAGILEVATDLTERRRVEEIEKDAMQMQVMEEFVASVSHELRTPLYAIKGFVDLLHGDAAEDPVLRQEFLTTIKRNADRLGELVNELLEISRLEADRVQLDLEDVDLGELINDTLTSLQGLAEPKGVRLVGLPTEPPLVVKADWGRIQQVLTNLVGNAVKFSPHGGTVMVTTLLTPTNVQISVADEGPGIAPEDVGRLFTKFFQASQQVKTPGGTGLGLYISKKLVELHGGHVDVASVVGQGSVFSFTLPYLTETETLDQSIVVSQ